MALAFRYRPGESALHRTDTRIKLLGMIALSLILVRISPFKLLILMPLLGAILIRSRSNARSGERAGLPLFLLIMPLIIFWGNLLSLRFSAGESWSLALTTGALRMGAFLSILMLAQLFIASTDPLSITPALYSLFKRIPLFPARGLAVRMGLSLSLIPLVLDEMNEIRDAMISRCGWQPNRPLRNLIRMGLPLLGGILQKAESLADAMESRCYTEDSTEPELPEGGLRLRPLLILCLLCVLLLLPGILPEEALIYPDLFSFY